MLFQYTSFAVGFAFVFASLYFYNRQKIRLSLGLLFAGAFLIRLAIIALDPFLNDWDERYHALVAKNMMQHPFMPMLRVFPVLENYDFKAWCCNHIWLHKQPLFMWQMALSMKLFGVNTIALRLPSALMGAALVFPVYRMGKLLSSANVGYYAAFLITFAYYQLEQIAGAIGMEHNDVGFMFYVTMSLWCFVEYVYNPSNRKLIFAIGLFAGMAVLCKWLAGLLVYAGWGLLLLLRRKDVGLRKNIADFLLSVLTAICTFLPWQIYTQIYFPQESSFERAYNSKHIWEVLENHGGGASYYLENLPFHYGHLLIALIFLGVLLSVKNLKRPTDWLLLAFILVPYLFFSLVAKTKLPSYVYFISPLVYILMGISLETIVKWFEDSKFAKLYGVLILLFFAFFSLRPFEIAALHVKNAKTEFITPDHDRAAKRSNTEIYKQLNELVPADYTIFNCKEFEDTEAMFFSDRNVYQWWMSEAEYNTLKAQGKKIAVFKDHTNQHLPGYLTGDSTVLVIDKGLK
jgi:4-amino-4-deoxy-L-arabinose transferase